MITEERIQEVIAIVDNWHKQSTDSDVLQELVEIVKQQQVEIERLREKLKTADIRYSGAVSLLNRDGYKIAELERKIKESK